MPENPSHFEQLPRLNRAAGQIEGIKRMIGEGQYCVDILTQLRAVRSALKTIELGVLEVHMKSCLSDSCCTGEKQRDEQIEEIMALLKKYE